MRLHLDQNAFRVLINTIHEKTGYRTDVLEKDYYVVLILRELADMQRDGLQAYFKGGTALYKALKTTRRFSEDIDLSVDTRGCSTAQNNKRLERATKRYEALPRDPSQSVTHRSEVISVYNYVPVTAYDADDALQRFGKLKIEATSFTISEPTESLEVSALIYDLADEDQRRILKSEYDVAPFQVQTITLECIFIDKMFAAEAYVRKSDIEHRAFEAAKHIYDLAVMREHPKIVQLMQDAAQMEKLLNIRMTEEMERNDGIPGVLPREFTFFTDAAHKPEVRKAYDAMQRQYVLREQDRIEFAAAALALDRISEQLSANEAWQKCEMPLVSLDDRAPATYSESKTGHEKRGMSKSRKRNPER